MLIDIVSNMLRTFYQKYWIDSIESIIIIVCKWHLRSMRVPLAWYENGTRTICKWHSQTIVSARSIVYLQYFRYYYFSTFDTMVPSITKKYINHNQKIYQPQCTIDTTLATLRSTHLYLKVTPMHRTKFYGISSLQWHPTFKQTTIGYKSFGTILQKIFSQYRKKTYICTSFVAVAIDNK